MEMIIHTLIRRWKLTDTMFSLGLSVSDDRVFELSAELAQRCCEQFKHEDVVRPPKLENVCSQLRHYTGDYDPSSTFSRNCFHEIEILLFEHQTKSLKDMKLL